jgi:hypothetical protein
MLEHNVQKFISMKIGLIFFILWYYFPDPCWVSSVYLKHKSTSWSNERGKSAGVNNLHSLLLHHTARSFIVEMPFLCRFKATEWPSCCYGHPSCSQAWNLPPVGHVVFEYDERKRRNMKSSRVSLHIGRRVLCVGTSWRLFEGNGTWPCFLSENAHFLFGPRHFRSVVILRMMITDAGKVISCSCHHPCNSVV